MVVTSKRGRVIVRREDGTRTTALDISARVCEDLERSLVGVAVDPAFATNRFVYLYYTHKVAGPAEATVLTPPTGSAASSFAATTLAATLTGPLFVPLPSLIPAPGW